MALPLSASVALVGALLAFVAAPTAAVCAAVLVVLGLVTAVHWPRQPPKSLEELACRRQEEALQRHRATHRRRVGGA